MVEVTKPVSPEVSSTLCWTGGQLLGAVFIIIMDSLKGGTWEGQPKENMKRALVFQAVVGVVAMPCALLLGFGRGKGKGRIRLEGRGTGSPVGGDGTI